MKIAVTGATGFIGKLLVERLLMENNQVFVIGRSQKKIHALFGNLVTGITWDIEKAASENIELLQCLEQVDAVINLAGENISAKRWNKKFKNGIIDSRVKSTRLLVDTIKKSESKPKAFISVSAIGYYGIINQEIITEDSPAGNDFMSRVCIEWEKASEEIVQMGIRRIIIRVGIVLSKEEGALKKMLLPYKLFLGGPLGSGKQYFPWIHHEDLIEIFLFALKTKADGIFNGVAPEIITMNKFSKILGEHLHRPSLFRVPKFILRIVIGEAADYFTEGLKIKPTRLAEVGFIFKFRKLEEAVKNLL